MLKDASQITAYISKSPFRSRFKLTEKDCRYIAEKGWPVIREQAHSVIAARLAAAFPENDGSQTPMRGHVVFTAQHATASCCRGCLQKWHNIPSGRPLSGNEIEYICDILLFWLKDHAGDLKRFPHTPDLFNDGNV